MITKDELLQTIIKEGEICKHLHSKIPAGSLSYRPTEGQRDLLELLRYISMVAVAPLDAYLTGNWDGARKYAEAANRMTAEEFPEAIDRQAEGLRELFAPLSEEDFRTRPIRSHTGEETPLGRAVIGTILKWMVGYRMQLFLYLKSIGVSDIGTTNCWYGVDYKPREEAVTEE